MTYEKFATAVWVICILLVFGAVLAEIDPQNVVYGVVVVWILLFAIPKLRTLIVTNQK